MGNKEHTSVVHMFRATAKKYAQSPAIKTLSGVWSYAELDARSDIIASVIRHQTQSKGRIALYFNTGPEAIAAILGVLKSGNAFVSLEVSDPGDRIQYILKDCNPLLILTDIRSSEVKDLFQNHNSLQTSDIIGLSKNPIEIEIKSDDLACIFYTSGSTGRPKGVTRSHSNLANSVPIYRDVLEIRPDDSLTLLYSLSFSASSADIFGALLQGATLCPFDLKTKGISSMKEWLQLCSPTILHSVPTVFRTICQAYIGEALLNFRRIILAGEEMFRNDVEALKQHFSPSCTLINLLGATETGLLTSFEASRDTFEGEIVPIGIPLTGVKIHIMRDDGTIAQPGDIGEIVVQSRSLTPGYWRNPSLTSKVISGSESSGGRQYHTGDLGYFDERGVLYFRGRKNARVKIRGISIELNEIEAALARLPGVGEAAVLHRPEKDGFLEAFLAVGKDQPRDKAQLRAQLRKALPQYMVPGHIHFRDRLPRTTSGKIDRLALSQSDTKPDNRETQVSYDNMQQNQIAALFNSLLELDSVGPDDDFFDLGGNSLLATVLHAELEILSKKRLDLNAILQTPTIRGISEKILASGVSKLASYSNIIPYRREGSKPALFLVHGRGGYAYFSPKFLEIIGKDQPLYGIQSIGLTDSQPPFDDIILMAQSYIEAIKAIQPVGPYLVGGLCKGGIVALEIARQLQEQSEIVGPILLIDPPSLVPNRHFLIRKPKIWYYGFLQMLPFDWKRITPTVFGMIQTVRQRANEGRVTFDPGKPAILAKAIQIEISFEIAFNRYDTPVFDHYVLVLGSSERIKGWRPGGVWNRYLAKQPLVFEVGRTHKHVLHMQSDAFKKAIQEYLAIAKKDLKGYGPSVQ